MFFEEVIVGSGEEFEDWKCFVEFVGIWEGQIVVKLWIKDKHITVVN